MNTFIVNLSHQRNPDLHGKSPDRHIN